MKRKRVLALIASVAIVSGCVSTGASASEYPTRAGIRAGVVSYCAGMIPEETPAEAAKEEAPAETVSAEAPDPDDTWIGEDEILICEDAGTIFHVSPEILEAIIESESSGQQYAQNGPCIGLMQVDYKYHTGRMQRMGFTDLYDKRANIYTGASLLVELCERYGDIGTALMAYSGTQNVTSRTTLTKYAERILNRSAELERIHGK